MSARITFVALVVVAAANVAYPAQIIVRAGVSGGPENVHLELHRLDAAQQPVLVTAAVPGVVDVPTPEGTWQVEETAPRKWWFESVTVASNTEVALTVWPVGRVRGTWRKTDAPSLRVSFRPVAPLADNAVTPKGEVGCTTEHEGWSCTLPVGLHHLQFMPGNSAPVFLWDKKITTSGVLDVGPIDVVPGASISGLIDFAPAALLKGAKKPEVRVTATFASGEPDKPAYTSAPDAHGVFVFAGLTPGEYLVRAYAGTLAATPVRVRVLPRLYAEIHEKLVLEAPRTFAVNLVPATLPDGRRWRVELLAQRAGFGSKFDLAAQGLADEQGSWTATRLQPGKYTVAVRVADDESQWFASEVTVSAPVERLLLTIPVQPARGIVKIGDRPLAAKLQFSQTKGARTALLASGDDGTFQGILPGGSDSDSWTVEVNADKLRVAARLRDVKPRVTDEGLVFELPVPRTVVSGRCVDEDRSPQRATITVRSEDGKTAQQVFSQDDGSFDILGLAPGRYSMVAAAFLKESPITPVTVTEEPAADIELVLKKKMEFKGRLFAPNQTPIPAGRVYALPRDTTVMFMPSATSDDVGGFDLVLPSGTTLADVAVYASGFAVSIGRVRIDPDKVMPFYSSFAGGTITVTATKSPLFIHHNGAEFTAQWLARQSGGEVDTANGRYVLQNVEPGQYDVCSGPECVQGHLAPGGTLDLKLR